MPKLKRGGFYAVAIERDGQLTIAKEPFFQTPLTSRTLTKARKMRKQQECADDLSILRCEPIE